MKEFTATHLNKHAQEVFAAAKDDGSVCIQHDRYEGGFTMRYQPVIYVLGESTVESEGDKFERPTAKPQPHPASDQQ